MTKIGRVLARYVWWALLWFVRRPWMKRLQRNSTRLVPAWMGERVWRSMKRQNTFARRHGLKMLTMAITFFLASVVVTACYEAALWLLDAGILRPQPEVRVPGVGRLDWIREART